MNTHELWQAVLGELELSLSKANFTTWFKNTFIASLEAEKVVISVPNTFTKAWLEKKYNQSILKTIQKVCTVPVKEVVYKVDVRPQMKPVSQAPQPIPEPTPVPPSGFGGGYQAGPGMPAGAAAAETQVGIATTTAPQTEGKLNSKYTFDTFIVGKGSELAHAAAVAVAENPGQKYNPLFIYGGVGLGKTHLIQAIGNSMQAKNPKAKILYVTCERFTNDFINAVKSGRGKDFKDTYRNVDLLLIDDIQFLTGKDGTQEEFFHTFNALHQANKQVVLTSDRPPKQIPALEQRLISRFEWGMMADISSPDYETRIAILETKCRERNYDLDPEIISHIADTVQSNVRELEGALNKIVAFHQFKNQRPTLESSKQLLSSFGPAQSQRNVTPKHLITTVAGYYDVTVQDMLGRCREKRLAFPRQVIMYLMREELRSSYPTIGNELGGRDHTTAMHAYDKIRRELENNNKLQADVEQIKQRLYTV
ncbi:chromosomal replication initiator protein DnaA [Patescibacteria group bacterium]